jgi:MFS family permease
MPTPPPASASQGVAAPATEPGRAAGWGRRASESLRAGPLAIRNFRLLAAGQATSTIGDFCYALALPWMVLSARGGGVALLGLVLACYGIPRTALIPVGGILADRLSSRVVMLAADSLRCVLVCAMLYLDAVHRVSLDTLGPVAALVGACSGLFVPASFSILPQLLPADLLQSGNAISSACNQLGAFAGPALAGALVAAFGTVPAFGVDAATFAVSALTLLLIRLKPAATPGEPDPAGGQRPGGKPGLLRLLREPVLQNLMVIAVIANLVLDGAFDVAMPDLAHARFGAGGYGALLACFGAGATVGALAAARRGSLRTPSVVACAAFVISGVGVAFVPYGGGLPGSCAAILLLAICMEFGNVILVTLAQQWAPPALLGRVMSLIMLASAGAFPLSVAVSGLLVHHFGPVPFFPVGGIVIAMTAIGAMTRKPIRQLGAVAASS